ncbi:MAG: ROK family protein [Pseudomonadota bacterium]
MENRFISIEAGGTKFVCAHGTNADDIQDRVVIPTKHPEETIPAIFQYIYKVAQKHTIAGIGLGIFGPIDLDPKSATHGFITTTPKKAWQNFDMVGHFKHEFNLPVGFEVDVNASALGEHRWGSAQGLTDFIYVTVGTGIGGGAMVGGQLLHGALHAEMGHIMVPHLPEDEFAGVCGHHQDCLEGLASGPSMCKRWQVDSALEIPEDHHAWEWEAQYLAYAMMNYTLCLSPQRIIIGGGVMRQDHLLDRIKIKTQAYLNEYIKHKNLTTEIDQYIVRPGLNENSGICGGIALAQNAWRQAQQKSHAAIAAS